MYRIAGESCEGLRYVGGVEKVWEWEKSKKKVFIDFLFDFPAYEGYHPVPSLRGYAASFCVGVLLFIKLKKK